MSDETLILPEEWNEEDHFAFRKCYFRADKKRTWDDMLFPLQLYVDSIKRDWPSAPSGLPGQDAANAIVAAVYSVGVAAIHFADVYDAPTHAGPAIEYSPSIRFTSDYTYRPFSDFPRAVGFSEPVGAWRELNQLVSAGIAQWQREVTVGRVKPSLRFIKAIGKALIPQAKGKGKRGRAVNEEEALFWYYKMLFRVTRTAEVLKTEGRAAGERIKLASEQYGLAVKEIKELWNIDEHNSPICRPVSLKQMARILTARHFGLTEHRVSNIIGS